MRRKETFRLGLADQPGDESFRLSILDLAAPSTYNTFAIVFSADEPRDEVIVDTLKRAVGATLLQCRHLVGRIEKNRHGDYSIVTKPTSTVDFAVQWLNGHDDEYPSYSDLERDNFCCQTLGSAATLGVEGMPSALGPQHAPRLAAFQLNLIRGGFILALHVHHFALDMAGTTSLVQQIARHCCSIQSGSPPPAWDESLMDRSRFFAPPIAPENQVDAMPQPRPHPAWLPCTWLLFHLPPSRAEELKRMASPANGTWISTYDALTALLWRILARNRARIYHPDLAEPAVFGHPINMRNRCTPQISQRFQGNVLAPGLSMTQKNPLTLAQVISEASLAQIATFLRGITASVTEQALHDSVARFAPVRDKSSLSLPLQSLHPLSFTTTDWRGSGLCDFDFGPVGRPRAYRNLADGVLGNMIVMYPPHKGGDGGQVQGIEVVLPFESHALDMLMNDADIQANFEFRGVEAAEM